jgi:hypothetical protein
VDAGPNALTVRRARSFSLSGLARVCVCAQGWPSLMLYPALAFMVAYSAVAALVAFWPVSKRLVSNASGCAVAATRGCLFCLMIDSSGSDAERLLPWLQNFASDAHRYPSELRDHNLQNLLHM